MREIGDDERAIVRSLTLHTNALAATAVGIKIGPSIDTHVDLVVLCPQQAQVLRLLTIDIVNEAICQSMSVHGSSDEARMLTCWVGDL
jgi:hypothetical protein